MNKIDIYRGRRDTFYYLTLHDLATTRDQQISELLTGSAPKRYFCGAYSNNEQQETIHYYNENLCLAKFWKELRSIEAFVRNNPEHQIHQLDRTEFIEQIPEQLTEEELSLLKEGKDSSEKDSYIRIHEHFLRNLKLRNLEIQGQENWQQLRSQYKAISAYKKVPDPHAWLSCPNCQLIPLVWEYNNGASTACGCGENEYQHFSIGAESIMSHVTRNNGSAANYKSYQLQKNWNNWVLTGVDSFSEQKKENPNLW